jgi:hypothetical protein
VNGIIDHYAATILSALQHAVKQKKVHCRPILTETWNVYLTGHVAANVGRRGFCPKHCQEWSIMWFSMHLSLFSFGMWYDIACKWKQQIPLKCLYLAHMVFHPRKLPSNIFVFTWHCSFFPCVPGYMMSHSSRQLYFYLLSRLYVVFLLKDKLHIF